ncbi:MAG: PAS domain S-box protein [Chitinophagaceae bacterium]|nr:PAS domain S-box protein [Chitinophagaceae bacterium]
MHKKINGGTTITSKKIRPLSGTKADTHEDFRTSGVFFKQLIESLKDYCVFTTDHLGNISSWNSGAEMMTGWSEAEIVGKSIGVLYTLADRRNKRPFQELLIAREKGKATNERWHVRKDGTTFWGSGLVFPLLDEKNKLRGYTKAMRNLTTERNKELALKESEAFSQSIFHSSPDCVKVLNPQGNIITMNNPGLQLLEISDLDMVQGKAWIEFWEGEYAEATQTAINRVKRGRTARFQGRMATMSGTYKWWDVMVSPIRGADGKTRQLLAVLRDITRLKEAEQEKQQMIVELKNEKEKLEENEVRLNQLQQQKDDFISMASHELKTPITSIKAYGQVLENIFRQKEFIREADMLLKLNAQVDRLTNLIGDLLDVTKIQSGRLQFKEDYFDFNAVVNEVREEIQLTAPRHTITTRFKKSGTLYGDKERIAQVLTNLISNAIKYSPHANKVIVETSYGKDKVIVSLTDFGVGIAKSNQKRIFEQFYRVTGNNQNTFPGLGLGLYISAEIIKRSGGEIWLSDSKMGKGSTFSFSLPYHKNTVNS